MSGPLSFSYDAPTDILTVEGLEFSGQFFRALAERGVPIGSVVRIEDRLDGVLWVNDLTDRIVPMLDAIETFSAEDGRLLERVVFDDQPGPAEAAIRRALASARWAQLA